MHIRITDTLMKGRLPAATQWLAIALLLGMVGIVACHTPSQGVNYLFDMGGRQPDSLPGFRLVQQDMPYTPAAGFGWLRMPTGRFDSASEKEPNRLLHKGLFTTDSMRFRADVANGDYLVRVVLGLPAKDTGALRVALNGEWQPDTVQIPYYRIQYRTVSKKMHITDGALVVDVRALSSRGAGICGIECRALTAQQPASFATPLQQDTADAVALMASLRAQLAKDPGNTALINQLNNTGDYLQACRDYEGGGWSWAVKSTGMSLFYRMYRAADLLEPICADPNDPLYNRALYLLARIYYWLDQEDENLYHTEKFKAWFAELKQRFPNDTLVRMYNGERFFDPPTFDTAAGNAPAWAVCQREAIKRMEKEIDWWVHRRQIANGEMGGKYGDDVELLRWWLPAVFGADDSTAQIGYKRLADGVWNSDALEDGFARRIDDVEHSAELFRDTHPSMLMMEYGDPEYVERCLRSMQHFRDTWTGITPLGHLHFKSYYLSASRVLEQSPYGIDVALNARALLPGLWAAWYTRNPQLIDIFSRYSRSWIADAARSDNGKPAGLMPSAIGFAQDRIGGESPDWWDAHLSYDYYQWDHIGHVGELHSHILGMYGITGNRAFLKSINDYARMMREGLRHAPSPGAKPGTYDWALGLLLNGGIDHEPGDNAMGRLFAMARELTQSHEYDSLVAQFGLPYNKFRITGRRQDIIEGLQTLLDHARYNWPLATSEAKFTDRVYMPSSDVVMGMYTGHFGGGFEYPSPVCTWQGTGSDMSIFVTDGNTRSAHISVYNFGDARQVQMHTWQLQPGTYKVSVGPDPNDDGRIDGEAKERVVELTERVNDIALSLPGRQQSAIIIEQIAPGKPVPRNAPDIAIAPRDIRLQAQAGAYGLFECRVHNIGNRAARHITLEIQVNDSTVAQRSIPLLEAPNDLRPRSIAVQLDVPYVPGGRYSVRIRQAEPEFTLRNNRVTWTQP